MTVDATCGVAERVRELPSTLALSGHGPHLRLRRAWPRHREHVLVEYVDARGRAVAGQWIADSRRRAEVAHATSGSFDIPAAGVVLQPGGADRRLTNLAALAADRRTELLAHRPERRAVLRRSDPDGVTTYLKVVRPGARLARLVDRAALATEVASATGGRLRVPRLHHADHDRGVLQFEALAGTSLFDLPGGAGWSPAWAEVGTALTRFLDGPISDVGGDLDDHRASDEAAVARHWVQQATTFGLLPAIDVEAVLAPLADGEPERTGLLHRDLHDKQVLVAPDHPVGLLDLDTLAVGERALDIANLLVHLELRVLQGRRTAAEGAAAASAILRGVAPDGSTRHRIRAYATATRLRLAAVYAFRPAWRPIARTLLTRAVQASPGRGFP
jgi:hypothetical protein